MDFNRPGGNGPGNAGKNSSGLMIVSLLATAASVGVAVVRVSNHTHGNLYDSLMLFVIAVVPLVALGALAIHVVKGKARRVAALTGSRAFLVMGNTNTGIEQLRTVDGYASPFFPVVTVHGRNFEIWRGAEEERPIVSIPLSAVTVEVDRQWAVYPHAAFVFRVLGIEEPIYFSLYGDRGWSFLTMTRASLEETGREIGLI